MALEQLLDEALARRTELRATLAREGTDCYRLFHGIAEGWPGLTIDRYGPLILVQTWRALLDEETLALLEERLAEEEGAFLVWNHRGKAPEGTRPRDNDQAERDIEAQEGGLRYRIRGRHRGRDPWLFLDLRTCRRHLLASAAGSRLDGRVCRARG